MKIAVMGAGALGCYFGGHLAAAGGDVAFIARGAHLDAMRRDGLKLESPLGDFALDKVTATDNPAEIGPVDLVFFLVKMQDTEKTLPLIAPLLGPETAILSFQNGVEAWEMIGAAHGAERVIGGTAAIPADVKAPGVIRHSGPFARLTIGEFDRPTSPRAEALVAALTAAGVEATLVPDIRVKIWEKFVMLSAFSAATAICRLPIGPIRDDPAAFEVFRRAAAETLTLGRLLCPGLAEDYLETALGFVANAPGEMRSSLLDDLSRGKPLELAYLSGAVARLAEANGIGAPTHDLIARALSPHAAGR